MKRYKQHQQYVPNLTRTEIAEWLDTNSYAPVGRKYLNAQILDKMTDLEEHGANIGSIFINPDRIIVFRAFITKPIWYIGQGDDIAIWTNEGEVQWIGK